MKPLACCRSRTQDFSLDFEEQERVMTYNGLESCILNSSSYDNESGASAADGFATTESLDEDASSCSSSKEAFGSCSSSSQYLILGKQEEEPLFHEWKALDRLHHLGIKGKEPATYTMHTSDVDSMKEKFARLLLGDDVSGGAKGVTTALALSNAITNLSATVFGELWKLEPLPEDKKIRWRREMDWLLSPTNYMVELVPAKQNGANGGMLEVGVTELGLPKAKSLHSKPTYSMLSAYVLYMAQIMTPKARSDVQMNLPAIQKLDSLLIEVLDSMVETEFWYAEGGSRGEGRTQSSGIKQSKKWWLPSPRVPDSGLSNAQRKKLGFQGKFVHQILKAAMSINEDVLLQIPLPAPVKDALPKSGKASLGEDIYRALTAEASSVEKIFLSLNLRNEHSVLEIVNQLEGSIYAWKQRLSGETSEKSHVRYPWHFVRGNRAEVEKVEVWLDKAESLLRLLKDRFPNLPQSFINVTKIQYNKDVGHSITEAYSRVVGNLAFSILSRIADILQEDDLKKPSTPIATLKFDFSSDVYLAGITETPPGHIKRSLIDQMNNVDGRLHNSNMTKASEEVSFLDCKAQTVMVITASPFRSRVWCYGREACIGNSYNSP